MDSAEVAPTQKISVKCRPKRLYELIRNLTDNQKSAVQRIGFGGMLELRFKNFPLEHIPLFLTSFDDGSYVFRLSRTRQFMLSKHDVHDCFLLPLGPKQLELVPTGRYKGSDDPENMSLKDRWREKYDVKKKSDPVKLGKIYSELQSDRDGGDHFCRLFVLFCMSSFLAPTSNNGVDFKLLKAVEDVSDISNFDWCTYVLDSMVEAAVESKRSPTHLLGCIPFLMISYFQRFDFGGKVCSHDLPLIKHWDEERMVTRINDEMAFGGLGRLTRSEVKYPRCIHLSSNASSSCAADPRLAIELPHKKFIQIELPPGVEDDDELKARAVDEVHELYLKLQRNAVAFHAWYADATAKIRRKTKDHVVPSSLVPSQSSQEFWEGEELHRYCDEVEDIAKRMRHSVSRAPVLKDVLTQKSKHEDDTASRQVSEVLIDLQKTNDVVELAGMSSDGVGVSCVPGGGGESPLKSLQLSVSSEIDAVSREPPSGGVSVVGVAHLGNDELHSGQVDMSTGGTMVSVEFYSTAEIKEAVQGDGEGGHVSEMGVSMRSVTEMSDREVLSTIYDADELDEAFRNAEQLGRSCTTRAESSDKDKVPASVVVERTDGRGADAPIYVPRTSLIHHPFLLHSVSPLPCMVGVPENLGCSFDCGAPDPQQIVVSEVFSDNKDIFSTVFTLRKEVMDYVFQDIMKCNRLELLVSYSDLLYINREDMSSLLPGLQVLTNVIECWCLLLNHIIREDSGSPGNSCCFFGLSHILTLLEIWEAKKKGIEIDLSEHLFRAWDLWIESCFSPFQLDANMVFLPVLSGDRDHYCCACVNFSSEQVEYLDNRGYDDDFDKLPYTSIARIAADGLGKYLLSKGFEKGAKVSAFKLVNVKFSWQRVGPSSQNCGVYMMVHMLLYRGSVFECDLGKKEYMDLFRAEIASTLVLSDVNKVREDVLSRVFSFVEGKSNQSKMKTRSSEMSDAADSAKRKADVETDCSVTYKRRRSCTPDAGTSNACSNDDDFADGGRLTALSSRPRGKGDGLGCSMDCGRRDELNIGISKFLRNNSSLTRFVKDLRKHVVDYCFLDDHIFVGVEVLVDYGGTATLRRDEFLSMLPDTPMSSFVIECWSKLLNHIESEESAEARMAFFGLRHTDVLMRMLDSTDQCTPNDSYCDALFKHWDVWRKDCGRTINLNADLIFIPLRIEDHIASVCINFKSNTIDLLDNQIHPHPRKSLTCQASAIIASAMSDYLEARGVSRGADVAGFEHRGIKFDWSKPFPNDAESGVFTMVHMLMYDGDAFLHEDLMHKVRRRYLIVQMAAALILADINQIRDKVLVKVNRFVSEKGDIWKKLQQIRRSVKTLSKKP